MNKLPLISTATLPSFIRAVLLVIFARFGWPIADEQLGEISAWLAAGIMILVSLLWSWLSDRKVYAGDVRALKPAAPPIVLLVLGTIVVCSLAACSPHQRATMSATELSATESPKNKGLFDKDGNTAIESSQSVTSVNVDNDGLDAVTEGQYMTATVGQNGVVMNSPGNVKAKVIKFKSRKPVFTSDDDGNQVVVRVTDPESGELVALVSEQDIEIEDYSEDKTANIAEFTKRVQSEVTYALELARTNVEKYREYMATIRATTPELADLIEGVVKAFVPAALPIP